MSIAHIERKHAILSASGSKRWLTCTPSAQLEQEFPEQKSEYAEEGTFAHDLAALHLSRQLGQLTKRSFETQHKSVITHKYYSQEMSEHIENYVDIVLERVNKARVITKDTIVLIEQKLDFSAWVPDGFGTGDVVIISDGAIEIIDLKYGKGVPVSAEDNTQMSLYALGAISQYGILYDIDIVRMTIVQPRLDNVSTEEISANKLLEWGNEYVRPRATMAIMGEGEFISGEHCQFCRVRFTCRARAEFNLELAKYDFKKSTLSIEEIADILARAEELQKWASEVQTFALDQAENHGVKYPGWKLVEGKANRKYTDENEVAQALISEGLEEEKIYKPKEILGITAMEKVLGKKQFSKLLGHLVIRPQGKITLAPDSDKRPEINSVASAREDFK
ncbi:MAG: DUF2800 domain-containing protein [Vulcanibacillus sp.]